MLDRLLATVDGLKKEKGGNDRCTGRWTNRWTGRGGGLSDELGVLTDLLWEECLHQKREAPLGLTEGMDEGEGTQEPELGLLDKMAKGVGLGVTDGLTDELD